jgi:DNA (cytosine-5)-methyltransferase 1
LKFGSLFAGIGGLDLGFERAGFECAWQVEIDPYCRKVLQKHWPEVPKHDDIRTFTNAPYVDVIVGGFPCQDISYAGKGAGLSGERSGLFYEAMRVVREVGPRIVVLENVAALLTRGMGDVLGTLASLGYDAEWHCIPAAAVGAPHIRDRVFILANNDSHHSRAPGKGKAEGRPAGLLVDASKPDTVASELSNTEGIRRGQRRTRRAAGTGARKEDPSSVANANGQGLAKRQGKDTSRAGANCRAQPIRSEWWESEPAVGRVADGVPRRVDRLRGLGNAVVPQVAEFIARALLAGMDAGGTSQDAD